jgi:hypothetical protein
MKRRLPNLLTALSLLLCVATAVVWARSYRHGQWLMHTDGTGWRALSDTEVTEWSAFCGNGVLHLRWLKYRWNLGVALHRGGANGWGVDGSAPDVYKQPPGPQTPANRLGFDFVEEHYTTEEKPGASRRVTLPLWLPVLLLALTPAAWTYRHLRRPGPGHCPRCGYDLRATPDLCPECGTSANSV